MPFAPFRRREQISHHRESKSLHKASSHYRHYQDKYDLVEQIFQQAINQLAIDLRPPGEAVLTQDPQNPPERWVKFFDHFAAHERLYHTLLGRKGSSWFVARMRDHFVSLMEERERLRDQLPAMQRKTQSPKVPREVALTLTANLIIGTIAWWLESGKQYSPRQIATWFLELLINGYVKVIGL